MTLQDFYPVGALFILVFVVVNVGYYGFPFVLWCLNRWRKRG